MRVQVGGIALVLAAVSGCAETAEDWIEKCVVEERKYRPLCECIAEYRAVPAVVGTTTPVDPDKLPPVPSATRGPRLYAMQVEPGPAIEKACRAKILRELRSEFIIDQPAGEQ